METGENPIEIQLSSGTPILLAGQELVLAWQIKSDKQEIETESFQISIQAPNFATPKDESLSADGNGSFILQPLDMSGDIAWDLPLEINGPVSFQITLLQNEKPVSQSSMTIYTGGILYEPDGDKILQRGNVTLQISEKALTSTAIFSVANPSEESSPHQTLSGYPLEILAFDAQSYQPITKFAEPITIQWKYQEDKIFDWREENLYLYYYEEIEKDWIPLPSQVDTETNIISAISDHLTIFDYQANTWQANQLPGMEGFQTADFTGAATYNYSFTIPQGPGGLQPQFSLNYNSQVVDEATVFTQASWVGMGWSLELGSILRNMHETEGDVNDDTFSISVGGIHSLLLPVQIDTPNNTISYNTSEQSFAKIIRNTSEDTWEVWTTDGMLYQFAFPTKTRKNDGCSTGDEENDLTWRWSLTKVQDIHGNQMLYTYHNEVKSATCKNEVGFYPETILYSNERYRVQFFVEEREDYLNVWKNNNQKTLFSMNRLQQIQIEYQPDGIWENPPDPIEVIRKYDFHYDPPEGIDNWVYPSLTWDGGGHTLTLQSVTESSGDDSLTLPATTFTYAEDHPHLEKIENGYGGITEIAYERWTYFDDTNKSIRSFKQKFGGSQQECSPAIGTSWEKHSGSVVQCNTMTINSQTEYGLQIGASQGAIAQHDIPQHMIKPGGRYRFYIKAAGFNGTTGLVSGFIHPFPTVRQAVINMTGISSVFLSEGDVSGGLSYDSDPNEDELKFYIECDHCFVKEFEAVLFPEYYRVTSKTISDVTTGDSYQYTYQYDNVSPNTPFVSDAVNESVFPYSNLYTYPMREYRGNAQTIQTDPGGLSSIQWYHQDDLLKGQSYHNLVAEIDYSEHFSNTEAGWENEWQLGQNTHTDGIYYQDFDPALYTYVSGSNLDGAVSRSQSSIQEHEFTLFHFRLNESSVDPYNPINPPGDPAASIGLTNGSENFQLWIEADTSHQYGVWLCNTNNDCNATGIELLAPGSFDENRWYAAIFQVDEGGSLKVKLWQLDEPENAAEDQLGGFTAESNWKYQHQLRSGALYIDSYMEGILYQETETSYQSSIQYDTIANNGIPDLASTKLNSYLDLQIVWNTISQVTTRSYEGSVRWVGTQTQYSYTSALNYGNLESQTESEWDGSAWSAFRQNRYLYYPFADASHYLVSLPASQEQYRCENADCSNRVLTAATRFLYDNNTTYQAAPTAGLLTTQRVLLTDSPATYQDTHYEYDSVGNIVQITNYREAGTETTLASTQPQHTIRCYGVEDTGTDCLEDNHHTYLLWEKNDLGHETQWEYDYKLGLPTQETDPNGAITYAVYDGLGRILQLIRPGDNSLSPTLFFAYHQETPFWTSVVQKTGEGQNNTLRNIYDGLGRLIQSQQAQQQLVDGNYDVLTEFTYDFRGNKISEYMPQKISPYNGTGAIYQPLTGNSLVANAYDILGRIISTIAPDDTLTTTSYGLDSNLQQSLTQVTDAKEQTTTYRKDAFGRTVAVEPATGPGVTYAYDSQNRLTDSDYGGAETHIAYDLAGRKTGMQDADMGGWAYGYDALGNLTSQTDAKGQITCLYYDDLNRLLGKNFQSSSTCPQTAGAYTVSFDYDASSSTNSGIGYRTSMDDASGSTAWEYDLRGRVIKEEKSILDPLGIDPLGTYHSYYSYYSDDQIKQMVLPNGEALDFDYLAQGALNAVSSDHWESGSITTIDYLKEMQYDEAGRVVSRTMGNDVSQIYDFNDWETAGGRLDTFTTGPIIDPLLNIAYGYDEVGNITGLTYSSDNLTESRIYSYDELNRLRTVTIGGLVTESVSYDPDNGNIDYKDGVEYGYDSIQPHAVNKLDSVQKYTYDANGSMTSRSVGGTTYSMGYDSENRMTSISGGTLNARYVFDGDGKRVLSVVGDTRTLYVNAYFEVEMVNNAKVNQDLTNEDVDICENRYCSFMPLAISDIEVIGMPIGNFGTRTFTTKIMEPDNANVTWRIYYPCGGLRVQTTSTENLSFMVQDHINSTAMTLNNSRAVTGEVIYSAWGEVRNLYGSTPTKKLFTGQYEAEAGLYFYNARWFDSELGRFVQADSIIPDSLNPQSWNRYTYVNNNPINFTDPSGHCIEIEPGFCVREDRNSGKTNIVYSMDGRFNNDVEQALANAILSGNTNYLNQIPNDTPGFMVGAALENACKGIGLNCGEYYNISFMMLSTVILDIGNVRYPGTSYNSVPGSVRSDALGDPDCVGCGYDLLNQSPSDILMPNGKPIGTYNKNPKIRTVDSESKMWRIFNELVVDARLITTTSYKGQLYELPTGGTVGIRSVSKSGGLTIDVNIFGIPINKIHLP